VSAPPRNAVAFLTPFTVSDERRFRRLRAATKRLRPLDFCELGSARPALVGGFAA
ncbi:MAG: hypothetical protein HDT24_03780, partial [Ruminococcus sp.]|nr:hypothetical protein [Ruminococcus sp.]